MKVESIVNGDVKLLLIPENTMEEEVIKQLMKQENELTEIRSTVQILNKSVKYAVLIGKKTNNKEEDPKETVNEDNP